MDLDKLLSLAPTLSHPLITSLANNVERAQHLHFLQLCSMRLSHESWCELGRALKHNRSV